MSTVGNKPKDVVNISTVGDLTVTGNTILGDAAGDTVTVRAGTAALPAIIPSGDPNTGVWFPAADTVAVSTGGAERMRINASGTATFSAPSPLAVTGSYAADAASRMLFSYRSGGWDSEIVSQGANASTNGRFSLISTRSDGTNPLFVMTVSTTGQALFQTPGGFGYGTGAGGTVTQGSGSGKATTVVLNKPTGQITMNAAALAAGASVVFTVNCSLAAIADTVSCICVANSDYIATPSYIAAGSFGIRVTNITSVSLSDALQIQFNLHKGATS